MGPIQFPLTSYFPGFPDFQVQEQRNGSLWATVGVRVTHSFRQLAVVFVFVEFFSSALLVLLPECHLIPSLKVKKRATCSGPFLKLSPGGLRHGMLIQKMHWVTYSCPQC